MRRIHPKCLSSYVSLLYMRWIHPPKCLSSHVSLLYMRWIHPFTLRMPAIISHVRLLYVCDGFTRLRMSATTRQSTLAVVFSTRDGFTRSPSERLPQYHTDVSLNLCIHWIHPFTLAVSVILPHSTWSASLSKAIC